MLNRALTYSLLILIVLQSGMALGDVHWPYESGTASVGHHHNFDVHGSDNHHTKLVGSEDSSATQWDSHNCCQCHGHSSSAIMMSAYRLLIVKCSSPLPEYVEGALTSLFETFLRPPKV